MALTSQPRNRASARQAHPSPTSPPTQPNPTAKKITANLRHANPLPTATEHLKTLPKKAGESADNPARVR